MTWRPSTLAFVLAIAVAVAAGSVSLVGRLQAPPILLSIVGTTDLHGFAFPNNDRGGLALLSGYLNNLRSARAADGGALLLVDSGDSFQGGIESNLSEGAMVADAYNAMGYTALAIGNHEFDFGSADRAGARQDRWGDQRGGVKFAAARAKFPFLAANLIDDETGKAVAWPNVRPSTMVEMAGLKIGLVGVMTGSALRATLAANVHGLHVAPLAETIVQEAKALRREGAQLVVVVAHAGGGCAQFDDPLELSSCDSSAEIFQVAYGLPQGLVSAIAAGHTHDGLANIVNGIPIIQAYSAGRAFARVDLTVNAIDGTIQNVRLFPPQDVVAGVRYEGRPVQADPAIVQAMAAELRRVRELQAMPLGIVLDGPVVRAGNVDSPLGNLFADAIRGGSHTDVAVNTNTRVGLRADLPEGPLTFGSLYDVFPFENRVAHVTLTGEELQSAFAAEIRRGRRGLLAISGVKVSARCGASGLEVSIRRSTGEPIPNTERLTVAMMDYLAAGVLFPALAPSDADIPPSAPILREVIEDWFRGKGGHLTRSDVTEYSQSRWDYPPAAVASCFAP